MDIFGVLGGLAIPCIVCFIVGLVLLVVEMFIPGFGVCGCLGIVSFVAVIVMQFMSNSFNAAVIITAIMLLVLTLLILLCLHSFQRGALSRSPIVNHQVIEKVEEGKAQSLMGKQGVTLTPLRPTGMVEIEGKRMNVETSGEFIPAGTTVTVVKEGAFGVQVQA